MGDQDRKTYTVADAAALLHIGQSTMRTYIRHGDIDVLRIGGRILITDTEMDRLLRDGIKNKSYTRDQTQGKG